MKILSLFKKIYFRYIVRKKNVLKIVCGASNTRYSDWISLNVDVLDITKKNQFDFLFKKKSINNILLEHVIEHLTPDDFLNFLEIAKNYLKDGGAIRVAVPDKNHPSFYVRNLTGINGSEPGADDHKAFYNIDDFKEISAKIGYKLIPVEYFDNYGKFISNNPTFDNGYISRCSKNYKGRFTDNKIEFNKLIESTSEENREQFFLLGISYTSLFCDFYL